MNPTLTIGLEQLTVVHRTERAGIVRTLKARGLLVDLRGRGAVDLYVMRSMDGAVIVRRRDRRYIGHVPMSARLELDSYLSTPTTTKGNGTTKGKGGKAGRQLGPKNNR